MATDATGTPTSLGIPKYNTAGNPPSGKGFNAAMDVLDGLLQDRVTVAGTRVLANKLLTGDANPSFRILGDGKLEWGAGGASAPDVSLYRGAVDVLQTDDQIRVVRASGANAYTVALNAGDANNTHTVEGSGKMWWGAGGGTAVDTNLYRNAADVLKTDDRLIVGNNGDPVSSAQLSAVRSGDAIEFGHANSAGYRSTIGCDNGGGKPRIAFYGEHGTTGSETIRTRGFRAVILATDNLGGFTVSNVANANADNQAQTLLLTVDKDAILYIKNNVAGTPGTPVGGGYLYTEAGALKYKGTSGTVTTIAVA